MQATINSVLVAIVLASINAYQMNYKWPSCMKTPKYLRPSMSNSGCPSWKAKSINDVRGTEADSHFNDVAGNQYLTDDRRQCDKPTHTNVTLGNTHYGVVQWGNVGGRGNHYDGIPKATTAPPTTQQQFNPSASAIVDDDDSELLEAQLTLTRVQLTARREKQRADRLGAELTDTQARLAAAESDLAAVQRELAKYEPGGF